VLCPEKLVFGWLAAALRSRGGCCGGLLAAVALALGFLAMVLGEFVAFIIFAFFVDVLLGDPLGQSSDCIRSGRHSSAWACYVDDMGLDDLPMPILIGLGLAIASTCAALASTCSPAAPLSMRLASAVAAAIGIALYRVYGWSTGRFF
jgi:hypothetical protein